MNKLRSVSGFCRVLGWCLKLSWDTSVFYTITRVFSEILTPILTIITAFIGRYVINLLAGQSVYDNPGTMLLIFLGSLFAVAIIRRLSQKLVQYCRAMHEDMTNAKIAQMLMSHALKADLEYFDNPKYYDKLNSANRDSYAIMQITWNSINVVSSAIAFAAAFAVLSQMSFLYGSVLLLAAIPSSIVAAKYTKLLYRLSLEQINGLRQMGYIQGIASERIFAQDLRLFGAGEKLKNRYIRIWEELFVKRRKTTRKRTVLVGILECLPELTAALIGVDIAFHVLAGYATVGDYSLYVGLVAQLWGAISMLSISIMFIYDNRMQLDNFKSIKNFKNHVEDSGTKILESVNTVEFKNVSFTYPEAKHEALSKISFSLRKEEKIALVGLNGSGKSTIIKLLLRLYDPTEGSIKINGTDIKEYTLASLRKNFSVYFQDMGNFSFTLRENLTIADEGYDGKEIEAAAIAAMSVASCDDITEKSHKGLDTHITRLFSDDGIELSGGQHQKLALARALFRRHNALILDEPSSNLDPKAEHEVFESLKRLTEGKMTIFTSHRLSNVFLADRIIVLEKGKVIEDGTEEQLLKNKHRFAELFKYQKEKYTSAGAVNQNS